MPSSAGTSALGITLVLTTHVSAIAVCAPVNTFTDTCTSVAEPGPDLQVGHGLGEAQGVKAAVARERAVQPVRARGVGQPQRVACKPSRSRSAPLAAGAARNSGATSEAPPSHLGRMVLGSHSVSLQCHLLVAPPAADSFEGLSRRRPPSGSKPAGDTLLEQGLPQLTLQTCVPVRLVSWQADAQYSSCVAGASTKYL